MTVLKRSCSALLLTLTACGSCGYSVRPDHGEERLGDGRLPRIAVLPFDTTSYRRGLEMRLSRFMADEIRARSPQSPASVERADWLVTGKIVRAFERVLSEDSDDSVRESSFWVVTEIVLRDRTADTIIGTTRITKSQPFSDRAGRFRTWEQASEEVLRETAEATVYWLEAASAQRAAQQKTPSEKNSAS